MIAWYALIGVMLGVATLIVVQAVMVGFREEFTDQSLERTRTSPSTTKPTRQAPPDG